MTHCEKVLAALSDGRWHTHWELYALGVMAHSRVSDLRKRGHVIEQRRKGDHYEYRLLGEAAVPSIPMAEESAAAASPSEPLQLALVGPAFRARRD